MPFTTTYHFRIGVIGVSINSQIPDFAEEYRNLYKNFQVPNEQSNFFEVNVRRSPFKSWRLKPRYLINSSKEGQFFSVAKQEVLPHIEWAINWQIALHFKNYYQIHASIVEFDGQPIIFPGAPGSGKTTISAALVIKGARYFSDEFALIDPATLLVHPYPKAFCIKEAAIPVIAQLKKGIELDSRWIKKKKGMVAFLDPWLLGDDPLASPARIRHIIFPAHDTQSSSKLVPMSKAEAVFELSKNSFSMLNYGGSGIRLLASIVRSATCHRLRMGDLEASCKLLTELVHNNAPRS